MPPPITVILAPYDPQWSELAAAHAERLRILSPNLTAVHHIGSTAVPGLIAKPIIDLMPLVADLAELDRQRPQVEALGYEWHGELGIPGRRYCTLSGVAPDVRRGTTAADNRNLPDATATRLVQLHFFTADSPHARRHLAFRDYLRAHPEAVIAYANEKRRARDLHPHDSHAYADEKSPWIRETETAALAWFATR